jgi:hypothetical protein
MSEREEEPQQKPSDKPEEATESAGSGDEHSDAPGPHGTGEVYPRGDRDEEEDD